jgi:hypothetical protein
MIGPFVELSESLGFWYDMSITDCNRHAGQNGTPLKSLGRSERSMKYHLNSSVFEG